VRKADSLRSRRSAGSTRKALDHVRKADSLRSRRSAGSTWLADYLGLSYREPPRLSAPLCKRFAPPSKMAIDSIARDLRRRKKCETWAQRSPLALESRRCARPLLGSYPSDEESATPGKITLLDGKTAAHGHHSEALAIADIDGADRPDRVWAGVLQRIAGSGAGLSVEVCRSTGTNVSRR
jgi:hypothetical protein